MRFFNTAGPIVPADHYHLDPLVRLHFDEISDLMAQKKYFVLHAPRQTGKTSCLLALQRELNQGDQYRCLYVNVEAAQAAREEVPAAMQTILAEVARRALLALHDDWPQQQVALILEQHGPHGALNGLLSGWAQVSTRPLVLLIDEIDSLVGDTLISVLRQLRAGYDQRPLAFPQSLILCGVRDVRDYRLRDDSGKSVITGGSAFNIKAESLRVGAFTAEEITQLLLQHTAETGQVFTPQAIARIAELTQGQPWLVNALAYEVTYRQKAHRDRTIVLTAEMIEQAKEAIILRRETHLDQLADKLKEPRVQRVMQALLTGSGLQEVASEDDLLYVLDLGLIIRGTEGPQVANPIYREVIPRQLTFMQQVHLESIQSTVWYLEPDHHLNLPKLLAAFQQFFREHAESWIERFAYKEAGPQLLLQAFLQRIVNGGGRIEREYGLGKRRTDLYLQWPLDPAQGHLGPVQRAVLELKILHQSLELTLAAGLAQTADYADRCNADEAHLLIFDRTPGKTWEERMGHSSELHGGRTILVWRM